jgi:hypothetical protein
MKTAVDFLIQELGEYFPHEIGGIEMLVFKAKEMERLQIKEAFNEGYRDAECDNDVKSDKDVSFYSNSENYYELTYGGKDE